MARRAFFSFYYKADNWRASQVRNMGAIESNSPVSDNEWETITSGRDPAIQKWIDSQLNGKSCTIVLIGTSTAGRKWIKYEIEKSWNDGKGLLGIFIHNLKDRQGNQSPKGRNPFEDFTMERDEVSLSTVVKAHNPPFYTSTTVYDYINRNIADWLEDAISTRINY